MRKILTGVSVIALAAILLPAAGSAQSPQAQPTEMQLLQRISRQPGDVANYLELAKLYRANRRFDEAEQMLVRALELLREERRTGQPVNATPSMWQPQTGVSGGVRGGVSGGVSGGVQAPLRVGGDIREPRKIKDVKPIYPEIAMASRVSGIVIIEAVIGVDGSVTDAKVLRSVPILDQAAVDAVRQWRYEPTILNGQPVPVIMTVTVSFTLTERSGRSAPR